jgi:hypothetical protein
MGSAQRFAAAHAAEIMSIGEGIKRMETFTLEDYLPSAEMFFDYLDVPPNGQVLLTPTREFLETDPIALETIQYVGKERGIEVAMAVVEPLDLRGEPPKTIAKAIEASDVFITMGDKKPNPITGHCLTALRARWDYGVKQVDLMGGKGVLASPCARFPVEILLTIARRLNETLRQGSELKIVDDRGTDLHFSYDPTEIFFGANVDSEHLGPGQRIDWPLGMIIIHTESCSGVAMVDCLTKVPTILEKPVRFTIRDGAAEIEERVETRRINAELRKPENTSLVTKLFIGVNPKGSATEGISRSGFGNLRQAAGMTRLFIGDKAGYVASEFSTAGYVFKPTILLNREVICNHGRLAALDDPLVRKIASKYGDPDQLLTQIA